MVRSADRGVSSIADYAEQRQDATGCSISLIVLYFMTMSTHADAPRGMEFLWSLTRRALRRALATYKPGGGELFHSDRGVEYLGCNFQRVLDRVGG